MASSHVRYGYRRLTVLLRREGWKVNAKRIYRLYSEEQLIVRTKQRRKMARALVKKVVFVAEVLPFVGQEFSLLGESLPEKSFDSTPRRRVCGVSFHRPRFLSWLSVFSFYGRVSVFTEKFRVRIV